MLKNKHLFLLTLGALIVAELLSLLGFVEPLITTMAAGAVLILTIWLTLKDPAYGFIILLTELFIGSQGYLLYLQIGNDRLSLRITLWILVMTMWLIGERQKLFKALKDFKYLIPFSVLLLTIIIALIHGLVTNNDLALIFTEAKRWLYLITLLPIVIIFKDQSKRAKLWPCLAAAGLWIALKTFIILFIFSHEMGLERLIYTWTRNNLLGEITLFPNGFSRVFLQSQIFAIVGFFVSLALFFKKLTLTGWKLRKTNIWHGLVASIFLAVIVTGLSRSFWVGLAGAFLITAIMAIIILKPSLKKIFLSLAYTLLVIVVNFVLLGAIIVFPFPRSLQSLDPSVLTQRATEFEAGAASRWALLPVMYEAIKQEPILGQGLGTTLTYLTSDPRVRLSSVDGLYTTNAFEWGWLDIWLKLGIIGLGAYLWFLWSIMAKTLKKPIKAPQWAFSAFAGLLGLVLLHFFTPYLNHPLGFGYLALIMLFIQEGTDQT